jgi:hypothetical protein
MAITTFIKKEETEKLESILKVQLKGVFNKNDRIVVKVLGGEGGGGYSIEREGVGSVWRGGCVGA